MDYRFFRRLLDIDSCSGSERALSGVLLKELPRWFSLCGAEPVVTSFEVGDGTENLLLSWGEPKVVFCSHMDTVPPNIPPRFVDADGNDLPEGEEERAVMVCGRGSNDAKGQIFAMAEACRRIASLGGSGFGLLLLSGEETGSYGAKSFAASDFRAPFLIVGEPTDNEMVLASKGTKSYAIHIGGRRCHSGYPENGVSAVNVFRCVMDLLDESGFPCDDILGETTWNVGRLESDNPQNILSDSLSCRLYFRTTFASDAQVVSRMKEIASMEFVDVESLGGDIPRRYLTLDDFPSKPVSFGSDAPHLNNFAERAIFGPGSILTAHTDGEFVLTEDLSKAVDAYVAMYNSLITRVI